ncbi:hypothetical protein UlMin_016481 [Ulmus minor]
MEKWLEELHARDEIYWKQRSRMEWLAHGDRNSKKFHLKASERKRKNGIKGLFNSSGEWCTGMDDILDITSRYFQNIFSSSTPSMSDMDSVMSCVTPQVTREMNLQLIRPFTGDEVWRALMDMHPTKAPGPDGLPALFFQKFGGILGSDITKAVLHILNDQGDISGWNKTLITLIPKVKEPKNVKDFRLISLCNVLYKIVSRSITNRFRLILNDVIGESQSAFVTGRLIMDNVLVGFETMHWIRQHRGGKTGYMALKLDMSKAYDIVEWTFLKGMMLRLGFHNGWVELVMRYDSLIFCRAKRADCFQLRQCLVLYEKASEQSINFDKSALSFSPNTGEMDREDICAMFGVTQVEGHDMYLGVPIFSMRNKRLQFGYIRDRVFKKLQGWKEKNFSQGGKEVLLKVVIQAISIYAMSCFIISNGTVKEIEAACARFWWVWRLVTRPSSLAARVLKAKYYPNSSIWEADANDSSFYAWKIILWGRNSVA